MNSRVNQQRVEVEGCAIQRCPKKWDKLMPTESGDVRFCAACWKQVHFASSAEHLRELASQNLCVAYEHQGERFLGRSRVSKELPEHQEPELFAAIFREKTGQASVEDLRLIALRFLKHRERNESLRYLRLLIEAGGQADTELILSANRLGIDATNPAPASPP